MSDRSTARQGEPAKPVEAVQQPSQTPGEIIQQARLALGVSLSEVSHEINLPEPKLRALEDNDYQALSAPTFVKGYLRSCCRYFNLNAVYVLDLYEQHARYLSDSGVAMEPPVVKSQPLEKPFPEWSWAVVAGGLVVMVMAAFFLWGGNKDAEPETASNAELAVTPDDRSSEDDEAGVEAQPTDTGRATETDVAQDARPELVPQADEQIEAQEAAQQRAQLATELLAEVEQPAADPETTEREPAIAATAARPLAALPSPVVTANQPKDELEFYFSGDCWIEIYDGAGQRLHQSLSRTGDTLTVVGDAPFSIMLGNAGVASLQLNGVTIPITPRPGRNTLRLTVGDEL